MLVKVLIDNIAGGTDFAPNNSAPNNSATNGCAPGNNCTPLCGEWGLSVYIEFEGNRYLLDTGASRKFAQNAAAILDDVEITLLTMGPGRAADIIREGLYRGADGGILLTDRKFAGADTLATSYALSQAIKKISPDIIIAGRQAIDGDTAQVGPQVAEKMGWPQITYAEEVLEVNDSKITIRRRLERGVETVTSPLPVLITVTATAAPCRPRHAKRLLKNKNARTMSELQAESLEQGNAYLIPEWGFNEIGGDEKSYGMSGSPTKVKKIENIILQAKESKILSSSDADIDMLVKELIASHTIG